MKTEIMEVKRDDVGKSAEVEVEVFESVLEGVKTIGSKRALKCLNYGYKQQVRSWAWRELGKKEKIPKDILKYFKEDKDRIKKLLQEMGGKSD